MLASGLQKEGRMGTCIRRRDVKEGKFDMEDEGGFIFRDELY